MGGGKVRRGGQEGNGRRVVGEQEGRGGAGVEGGYVLGGVVGGEGEGEGGAGEEGGDSEYKK